VPAKRAATRRSEPRITATTHSPPRQEIERPLNVAPLREPHLRALWFEIVGPLQDAQTIATSNRIRELPRLLKQYGRGRWGKRKGIATVRLVDGTMRQAEIHWYEATGVGRKELKIKRYLDLP
jgi:hypothetical protein